MLLWNFVGYITYLDIIHLNVGILCFFLKFFNSHEIIDSMFVDKVYIFTMGFYNQFVSFHRRSMI